MSWYVSWYRHGGIYFRSMRGTCAVARIWRASTGTGGVSRGGGVVTGFLAAVPAVALRTVETFTSDPRALVIHAECGRKCCSPVHEGLQKLIVRIYAEHLPS